MSVAASAAAREPSASEYVRSRRQAWLTGVVLAAFGLLMLPLDLPVTRWATGGHMPKMLHKAINLSEVFNHGTGAGFILLAVFVLDRAHRAVLPRLVAGTLLGGVAANVTKLLVARIRPRDFDLGGQVLDSFTGWLPLGQVPSDHQGFPSAHAATGFALALMLAWRYPAGRIFFYVLAVMSGAQRVFSGAHFPSDVLVGGALGCLGASLCLPGGLLGRVFDRLEEKRRRARGRAPEAARRDA